MGRGRRVTTNLETSPLDNIHLGYKQSRQTSTVGSGAVYSEYAYDFALEEVVDEREPRQCQFCFEVEWDCDCGGLEPLCNFCLQPEEECHCGCSSFESYQKREGPGEGAVIADDDNSEPSGEEFSSFGDEASSSGVVWVGRSACIYDVQPVADSETDDGFSLVDVEESDCDVRSVCSDLSEITVAHPAAALYKDIASLPPANTDNAAAALTKSYRRTSRHKQDQWRPFFPPVKEEATLATQGVLVLPAKKPSTLFHEDSELYDMYKNHGSMIDLKNKDRRRRNH